MRTLSVILVGVVVGWAVSGVDRTRDAIGEEQINNGLPATDAPATLNQTKDIVAGRIVILQHLKAFGDEVAIHPQKVNVGGLVAIRIDDTAGEPTKFKEPTIKPADSLQRLGELWSAENEAGAMNLSGSGFKWLLYTPTKAGKASITLAYSPNGKGEDVIRQHVVEIVEGKETNREDVEVHSLRHRSTVLRGQRRLFGITQNTEFFAPQLT